MPSEHGHGEELVRRLVTEVMNGGRLEVIDELYSPLLAPLARRWITPFLTAFPDTHMAVVTLVSDGDTVAARFRCSGTHLGPWRGHAPTGRRFHNVAEVYFFTIADRRITHAWGLEDTDRRQRQLGI